MSTAVVPFQPNINAIAAAIASAIASANDAFDDSDADVAGYIADSLDMGMTAGMNPLTLANYLSFLVGPQRAENIARTEMLGGYRDAALNMYRGNSDVVGGWMWSAAAGACVACSEEDGTIHDLDEDMDGMTHNSCRCSPIPITNPWSDILGPLGIDVSDIEETSILDDYVPLSETFWQRSFEEQAGILGSKSAAEAVSRGILVPHDFVGHIEGGKYEGALYTKSLREALADKGMSKAEIAAVKSDLLAAVKSGDVEAAATSAVRTEAVVRDELAQARTRLDAAQTRLDELSARLSARPRETFTSRAEVHAANVEYLTAQRAVAQLRSELDRLTGAVLEAREPQTLSEQAAKLAAQREKLAVQRDTAQATLDRLSDQWVKLVLQTGEFDPVDDSEELAALEDKIAAVEAQQAVQIARLDKLDQQIAAVDSKIAEANMPGAERVQMLRRQADESMVAREGLYAQQHDLLAEQAKLENQLQNANGLIGGAQHRALYDLYHGTLDQTDPEVKQYLKDLAAHQKAQADMDAARAEQERLQRVMDQLAVQGKKGSAEYAQARADQDAAVKAYEKGIKANQRTWEHLWQRSPGVYKPELDSIGGFDIRLRQMGLHFTPEQIANAPRVLAERERIAGLATRIEDVKGQVKALDKPIKDINKEINAQLARLRELHATLSTGADALDTLRPFSDVIVLPEGHQPPNELMLKLDYRMHEPRAVTKSRIIDDISTRLKDNPDWAEYVSRSRVPDLGREYHDYIPEYATARDTKSAQLVADWIKKWGVGYRPGAPQWVAMQMAARDEFGLDATIRTVLSDAQVRAGEAYYTENGAALRGFMRAMYDNTQQWFADHGITEVDLYRGMGWREESESVPKGIHWGPLDKQNAGVQEMSFNPVQSFSADINVSQGTGAGNGFAGGGFGGGSDYSLLVGARIPVDRILSTAQTGFGAKLESEVVVMGRATDTVAYRAGTRVADALVRQADEQAITDAHLVYALEDGTRVAVLANADGTFTLSYVDGPEGKLGTLKLGSSKTYKTEKGVNSALKSMHIANTYVAPAPEELAIREGEEGAAAARAGAAGGDGLTARIDHIPADASVADMQDYVQAQLPHLARVDLMDLDAQTARLVANATVNLIQQMPEAADHIELIIAGPRPTAALAYVSPDGRSLIINTDKWLDLESMPVRFAQLHAYGWWVSQTPEDVLGHEMGHLLQLSYRISNDTWVAAEDRVLAAGGNPFVSEYAKDKTEESFAETFALLIYGEPTDAQLPIARAMADLLRDEGIDYNRLRAAVGLSPLDLGASN